MKSAINKKMNNVVHKLYLVTLKYPLEIERARELDERDSRNSRLTRDFGEQNDK